MNSKSSVAALVAVLLFGQSSAIAESRPIELKWSELSSQIQEHTIVLVLPDATSLRGEVEAIREDEIVLNVQEDLKLKSAPQGERRDPPSLGQRLLAR